MHLNWYLILMSSLLATVWSQVFVCTRVCNISQEVVKGTTQLLRRHCQCFGHSTSSVTTTITTASPPQPETPGRSRVRAPGDLLPTAPICELLCAFGMGGNACGCGAVLISRKRRNNS
ncbi:hypothetical protein BsWGS_28138 [Bradybaena similaris]